MKINEIYRFADFTLSNYKKLIQLAKEKFSLKKYTNFSNKSNEIIWRHDVEFSATISLEMAKMEAKLGIEAIYFVNIHSEFYSFFEKSTFNEIKNILDLGHHIGLHFDCHFYDIQTLEELENNINFERELLENVLGITIDSFSYHNTTPEILNWNDEKIAGLINVYSKYFREEVDYCTDSTGIWRYDRLEDKLLEKRNCGLQVLTHDGMWQDKPLSPRKRVFQCIDDRAIQTKEYYDMILKKHNQKNVDDDVVL